MRVIHCADVHLDSKMTTHLPVERARRRRRELLQTFQRMVEFAKIQKVQAIIIAGDLFDSPKISMLAKNTVEDAIVSNPNIDFYYIKGNHDGDGFLNSLEEIPRNLKLFQDTWKSYALDKVGEVVITGIELEEADAEKVYRDLDLRKDCFNIVVMHGQEAESFNFENAEIINRKALMHKGIDYLALGHVHFHKIAPLDTRGIYCYSGCLEARGFDEVGEHGFMLLDIDEQTKQFRYQFIPLANRRFHEKVVDITGCRSSAEISKKVERVLAEEDLPKKDILKLILVGKVEVDAEKDIEMIKKKWEDSFYFLKIQDNSTWQVDYADYTLEKSLRGEFIRMVEGQNISEEEKGRIIQCGLMALRGEELE